MENKSVLAATLQKKKTTISKGKVKKTIKNTLYRPDPIFWPNVSVGEAKSLEDALSVYKIEIPEFIKPHWKALKAIPKDQRPKPPKTKKVEGLMFGIRECTDALKCKDCSAVIIESTINPRILIQPLIEACKTNEVPYLCLDGLRKITSINFGIPTSCLGVKTGFLQELKCIIENIAKLHKPSQNKIITEKMQQDNKKIHEEMEVEHINISEIKKAPIDFKYLYRTSKKSRMFNPSTEEPKSKKAFIGQDFITFSKIEPEKINNTKPHLSMILKKITNNQNRVKRK